MAAEGVLYHMHCCCTWMGWARRRPARAPTRAARASGLLQPLLSAAAHTCSLALLLAAGMGWEVQSCRDRGAWHLCGGGGARRHRVLARRCHTTAGTALLSHPATHPLPAAVLKQWQLVSRMPHHKVLVSKHA